MARRDIGSLHFVFVEKALPRILQQTPPVRGSPTGSSRRTAQQPNHFGNPHKFRKSQFKIIIHSPMNSSVIMLPKNKRIMPPSFRPHEFSVVIGKGKDARRAAGTMILRSSIEAKLQEYKAAARRLDKALIVSDLLFQQQLRCPEGGAFVKFDGKRWLELSEHDARENITAAFRNRLHENYKSSSKYKSAKRRSQLKHRAARNSQGSASASGALVEPLQSAKRANLVLPETVVVSAGEDEMESSTSSEHDAAFDVPPTSLKRIQSLCNPAFMGGGASHTRMSFKSLFSTSILEPINEYALFSDIDRDALLEPVDASIFDLDTTPAVGLQRPPNSRHYSVAAV